MDTRTRLHRFYQKYNADKLDEVDTVLEKYKGKEKQLFDALIRKYGDEPSADEDLDGANEEDESELANPFKQRLADFYAKYNPDKLADVDSTLEKYSGNEAKLFDALVRKYGPEPGDEEEEDDSEEEGDDDVEEKSAGSTHKPVLYCGVCTLPAEYCEYGSAFDDCKPWLLENCPDLVLQKYDKTVAQVIDIEKQIADGVEGITLELVGAKKTAKSKKKAVAKDDEKKGSRIFIERFQRSRKKCVTIIAGVESIENVKLKNGLKKLGKKFACSASISKVEGGGQQIQLQGDCMAELPDLLVEIFSIPEEKIFFVEKGKTEPAF